MLDALLYRRDPAVDLVMDPLSLVRRYDSPGDQEVAGLVASSLAYGNVRAVLRSVENVLDRLGPSPHATLLETSYDELAATLDGFVHRWTRGPHLTEVLWGAARIIRDRGSLGASFEDHFERTGALRPAIGAFVHELRGPDEVSRGARYVLPDGVGAGACKRLHMFLRWMIRPADGVDLGLWRVPPSVLVMPLDTHTGRICRYIGLSRRKTVDWRMAEEVTWNLKALDPDDPVKYDFALAHLGMSGECQHRRVEAICSGCSLDPVCRL